MADLLGVALHRYIVQETGESPQQELSVSGMQCYQRHLSIWDRIFPYQREDIQWEIVLYRYV